MRILFTLLSALLPLLLFAVGNTGLKPVANKPLYFIENKGQVTDQYYNPRPDVDFKLSATSGLNIFIGSGAIYYQFYMPDTSIKQNARQNDTMFAEGEPCINDSVNYLMYRMDVDLVGANKHALLVKQGRQEYYENYYTPGVGTDGVTVYAYEKITYKNVYPNIDWVLYVNTKRGNTVKYDFIIHPGGDPSVIQLKYRGASQLKLNEDGSLIASTPQGIITENAPVCLQEDGAKVASRFVLSGNVLKYYVSPYEGILIIDPGLDWSTYYGGSSIDANQEVIIDKNGTGVYIDGSTASWNNIVTSGAHQTSYEGNYDAFLAKFDFKGQLIWGTYMGGISTESCYSIAADMSGNVYMGGTTKSTSSIATVGCHQDTLCLDYFGGTNRTDAFLSKFDSYGHRVWSTYYGGHEMEETYCIAVDAGNNVYMAGMSQSWNIHNKYEVATPGAHWVGGGGYFDKGFVVKFDSSGVRKWGTYYGGVAWKSSDTKIYGMAIDPDFKIIVTGRTFSDTAIATNGAFQQYLKPHGDAFVGKFDSSGVYLWGTYFGDSLLDVGASVITDKLSNIYLCGYTASINNISTQGSHQPTNKGLYDAFLAKFDSSGNRLWSTYYGGEGDEYATCIDIDDSDNVYMTGYTKSSTNISRNNSSQYSGAEDVFVAKFSKDDTLLWAGYYGGPLKDLGASITCNNVEGVYISGLTYSDTVWATSGVHQTALGGLCDGFLSKICFTPPVLDSISGTVTLCIGDSSILSNKDKRGSWASTNGHVVIDSNGRVWSISTGVDTVTYTVTNSCGADTVLHTIAVMPLPAIMMQPNDMAVSTGSGSSYFTILTTGSGISYQWLENRGSGFRVLSDSGQYSGTNTNMLTISNTYSAYNGWQFRCILSTVNCSDTSATATLYVWPLEVDDSSISVISISPNPTSGTVTVTSSAIIEQLTLTDLLGKQVLSQTGGGKTVHADMSSLAAGVYIIKVNGSVAGRVVRK